MPTSPGTSGYRLVALDVDGTVLTSDQQVSAELRDALALLSRRGVRTVLSTGRRWRTTVPVLKELGHVHPVAVCSGGALIRSWDCQGTLYTHPLRGSTARLIAGLFRESGLVPLLLYDRPLKGRELKVGRCDRRRAERLPYLRANPDTYEFYPGEFPDADTDVLTVYTVDDGETIRAAEAPIVEGLGELGTVKVMAQERYGPGQVALEVHDPGATKWHALRWLLQGWEIAPGEVVAVGDDVNDLPMIESAGLGVAMGNAIPAVKEAADMVTASNDEHGAAVALREIFALGERSGRDEDR